MGVAESMLQTLLPSPQSVAIAAATVGEDVQVGGVGVASAAGGAPPVFGAVDGEEGRVMGLSDDDSAGIGVRIIDAVGHAEALGCCSDYSDVRFSNSSAGSQAGFSTLIRSCRTRTGRTATGNRLQPRTYEISYRADVIELF